MAINDYELLPIISSLLRRQKNNNLKFKISYKENQSEKKRWIKTRWISTLAMHRPSNRYDKVVLQVSLAFNSLEARWNRSQAVIIVQTTTRSAFSFLRRMTPKLLTTMRFKHKHQLWWYQTHKKYKAIRSCKTKITTIAIWVKLIIAVRRCAKRYQITTWISVLLPQSI